MSLSGKSTYQLMIPCLPLSRSSHMRDGYARSGKRELMRSNLGRG
jgi:hypothetical protein